MKSQILIIVLLAALLLTACEVTPPSDVEATAPAVSEAAQSAQPTDTPISPTDTPVPPTATPVSPTTTPSPTPGIGSTWVRPKDGVVMVYVPAGEFTMGSPKGEGSDNEHPQHTVYLDAFWIDNTEVTNAQYRKCVEALACEPSKCSDDLDFNGNELDFNGEDQPVVCVDWYQAAAYAEWVGGRLPTEAEWEKAARGTDRRKYPWGDEFDGSHLNFCDKNCPDILVGDADEDDGYEYTAPVGSYPAGASPYGALDMVGNVWEWVSDWSDKNYYGRSPRENPAGPETGKFRGVRGGSFLNVAGMTRCTYRGGAYPDGPGWFHGFRVVVSPTLTPTLSSPTTMSTSEPTAMSTSTAIPTPASTPMPISIFGRAQSYDDPPRPAPNRKIVLCLVKKTSQKEDSPFVEASCVLDANFTTMTDSMGYFEFQEVPEGSYMLLYDDNVEDFEAGLREWDQKAIKVWDLDEWSAQFTDQEGALPVDENVLNETLQMLPSSNFLLTSFVTTYVNAIEGFPFLVAAKIDLEGVAFTPVIVEVKTGEKALVNMKVFGSKEK